MEKQLMVCTGCDEQHYLAGSMDSVLATRNRPCPDSECWGSLVFDLS